MCLPASPELSKQRYMLLIVTPAEPHYVSNLIGQWHSCCQIRRMPVSAGMGVETSEAAGKSLFAAPHTVTVWTSSSLLVKPSSRLGCVSACNSSINESRHPFPLRELSWWMCFESISICLLRVPGPRAQAEQQRQQHID